MSLACIVPIAGGIDGLVNSAAMVRDVGPPIATDLDSHFRYLSGLLLGIGIAFLSAVPRIERQASLVRTLAFIVVLGGLSRLLALAMHGPPGPSHRLALAMELGVVPLLTWWQGRIARRCASSPGSGLHQK